jgi:hypothetical protein
MFVRTATVNLTGVSDSLGNTYQVVAGPFEHGAPNLRAYIVIAEDSPAGADTLTITLSAVPNDELEVAVDEYSGLATASVFDMSSTSAGSGDGLDAISGSVATTTGHELAFGYAMGPCVTAGTDFPMRSLVHGDMTEDREVFAIGSFPLTATIGCGPGAWGMVMATFKGR